MVVGVVMLVSKRGRLSCRVVLSDEEQRKAREAEEVGAGGEQIIKTDGAGSLTLSLPSGKHRQGSHTINTMGVPDTIHIETATVRHHVHFMYSLSTTDTRSRHSLPITSYQIEAPTGAQM